VFKNEYVTVLKIDLPPHRNTGFNVHTTDSVSVNIEEAEMANQLPGEKQTPPQHSKRGQANFTAYSKQGPRTHKASNLGETAFHNVSFLFNHAQPGRFSPSSRSGVFGYTEIMDNERLRLAPCAGPRPNRGSLYPDCARIAHRARWWEIAEIVASQPDRGICPRGILLARTWYDACDS